MRGCCHRTAKSANLGTSDLKNTVDLTSVAQKDYGPVINDPSESSQTCSSVSVLISFRLWSLDSNLLFTPQQHPSHHFKSLTTIR